MKSKLLILLLAGLMVIGSLSGCSFASNDEAETSAQTEEEEAAAIEAAAYMPYKAGRAYLYGLDGMEVDLESAYTNFKDAAELGKIEANFYLGVLCDWYCYPEQDFEMARVYYEKCGDDPYAQLALGLLYYYGSGVEKDKERAKEIFQSVIEQGYVEGYFGTGCCLHDEKKYEEALEDYIKASEGTEQIFVTSAMNNIGWMYDNGEGVEQDDAMAAEWYEKAADLGDINAMHNIGRMYQQGEGVKQDYEVAMEWYEIAADQGDASAMYEIGWMYAHGEGVEQDYETALEWYKKAADIGDASAMNAIGAMYFYGEGVEQDYEVALEWYEKAVDLGNVPAINNIGAMYFYGNGVEQDYETALEWYEKAAALGDGNAMNNIGVMYYNGDGVEQDYETALEWFETAADFGSENAEVNAEYVRQLIQ